MRLGELIPRVTNAYEEFEFHSIFHALNNFCSVDMSAIYLDILKDRLYTFHKDSPFRRGSQTVLLEIVVALTKLMAPVLSFTAEEIWRMLPKSATVDLPSVHLSAFPKADSLWANTDSLLCNGSNYWKFENRFRRIGKSPKGQSDRFFS